MALGVPDYIIPILYTITKYILYELNWFEHLTSPNVKNFYRCAPGVSMLNYKIEKNSYLQFIFIYKMLFTYRVNSIINENCNFFFSTN
jgi:hypothetical protein